MRRHPTLIPLSREHHEVLILSQLIKNDGPQYKGLPETTEGKREFALKLFSKNIRPHFEKEEALLKQVTHYHESIASLAAVIINEHRQIETLFARLENDSETASILDETGVLLEAHIRKEERELFPAIQQYCPEEILQQLA
jgi:Hemerythrin HHE cation binding domain